LSVVVAGAGHVDAARQLLIDHMDAARGDPAGIEIIVLGFAILAFLSGDPATASRLLSWFRSRTIDAGRIVPDPGGFALYEHYTRLVRQALMPEDVRRLRDEGRAMSEEEVLASGMEQREVSPATFQGVGTVTGTMGTTAV
jgi:hypothetical protein